MKENLLLCVRLKKKKQLKCVLIRSELLLKVMKIIIKQNISKN